MDRDGTDDRQDVNPAGDRMLDREAADDQESNPDEVRVHAEEPPGDDDSFYGGEEDELALAYDEFDEDITGLEGLDESMDFDAMGNYIGDAEGAQEEEAERNSVIKSAIKSPELEQQSEAISLSDDCSFSSTDDESNESGLSEFVPIHATRRSSWVAVAGNSQDDSGELLRVTNDDLQEASLRGDVGLVRRLIECRASVNAPMRPEDEDEFMTLMHILARKPHMPNCTSIIAEMVRHKANLNVRSSFGTTPLSFACHAKHLGAVEVLLRAKASADAIDDYGRKAPLYAILPAWDDALCDNGDEVLTVKSIQLLAKAHMNLNDGGDQAPIVEAVKRQNAPAVTALLAAGVVPLGLHSAVEEAHHGIINSLIVAEANPFLKDESGKTVMDVALEKGDEDVVDIIRDFIGDLHRVHHRHLDTMAFNRREEEEKEAKDRDLVSEPQNKEKARAEQMRRLGIEEEHEETFFESMYSSLSHICKKVNKNRIFQGIMFFCLLLALFIADIWIMFDIESSLGLDSILTTILVAFATEFTVQLLAHTRSYSFSFFFWMDLLGVLSVPLDHSLVTNAIPDGLDSNAVVMRAARMAKLGARAGRFTKLVKLLRFMPGMQQTNSAGTAKVISGTLNMALSVRVALLIIVMVMVLPLFSMATYPENDFSMKMFTDLISYTAAEEPEFIPGVLDQLVTFYADSKFFPFEVQVDYRNGTIVTRDLGREKPNRFKSRMQIKASEGDTIAVFNFKHPHMIDSICNIALIVTIMILMIGSALFMSNSVSAIVVVPLEEMLEKVRDVAANIFKSVASMETKEEDEDEEDENQDSADAFGNETILLDKVLKKIAALSAIQVNKSPIDDATLEGMGEADRGLVSGYSEAVVKEADLKSLGGSYEVDENEIMDSIENMLTDAGMTGDDFESWDLDIADLSREAKFAVCTCAIMSAHSSVIGRKAMSSTWLDSCRLFLEAAEQGYSDSVKVPYHTWTHAVDVTFSVSHLLTVGVTDQYLTPMDCLGLMVAAVGHDIGHKGRNNAFLVETAHELALRYNDQSPLESMHCSKLFGLLADPSMNILSELSQAQYKEIRYVMVEAILHTDFSFHVPMVKEFEALYHVNVDLFASAEDMYITAMMDFPPREVIDFFHGADVKKNLRNAFLHMSDISNPMKSFPIAKKWAMMVLDEFFLQGDDELALGIPLQPLNDRKTNKPMSQIGFIEFFVAPLAFVLAKMVPPLEFTVPILMDNSGLWFEQWQEEVSPSEEEQEKVQERLNRLIMKAAQRGAPES
eukprot:TRINITY_DN26755_c0_g1_i2.p1 TRINITY_DN26755_c0_g1~~TRINITY_DN26755_c0_g1_i2.p1  ORF type:complete len:1269 (-),score=357.48 TRINITY_DN26755_c0_g1_i2:10-3816(-)